MFMWWLYPTCLAVARSHSYVSLAANVCEIPDTFVLRDSWVPCSPFPSFAVSVSLVLRALEVPSQSEKIRQQVGVTVKFFTTRLRCSTRLTDVCLLCSFVFGSRERVLYCHPFFAFLSWSHR